MERKPPKLMTPFDSLITPPYLYTLKLIIPYTPPSTQRFLACYIKFLELRYTLEHFHGFPSHSSSKILEELKDYMSPSEKEMMEQMEHMMNMLEMIQSIQTMGDSASGSEGFNPMEMMKGILTPEQQQMFQMYNTMFESETESPDSGNQKGETNYE